MDIKIFYVYMPFHFEEMYPEGFTMTRLKPRKLVNVKLILIPFKSVNMSMKGIAYVK